MYIDVYSNKRVDISPGQSKTFPVRFSTPFTRPIEDVEIYLKLFGGIEFPSRVMAQITKEDLTLTNRSDQVVSVFTDVPIAVLELPEKVATFASKVEVVEYPKVTPLDTLNVSDRIIDLLIGAGYIDVESLKGVSVSEIRAIKGIGGATAKRIAENVSDVLSGNKEDPGW